MITKIADNPYVRASALLITIAAGVLTIYHLQYQLRLTKLTLAKAERELKTPA